MVRNVIATQTSRKVSAAVVHGLVAGTAAPGTTQAVCCAFDVVGEGQSVQDGLPGFAAMNPFAHTEQPVAAESENVPAGQA